MKAILFDLDGVLYVGDQPIEGAPEAVAWVRQRHIPHLFLTNTTSRPRTAIAEKLAGMGIAVEADEILTPPVAAAQWAGSHCERPLALFVPDATRREFAALEIQDPCDTAAPGAVVVGDLGEAWDFTTLNRAFRLLMLTPQPELVALGMTRYWRAMDGLRLDAGAFVKALAYASGIEPRVMGKPSNDFFLTATNRLAVSPAETVMIGDDIMGDIGGAQAAGITGLMVKTGKFRPQDLQGEIRPAAVIDSIAELPAWWEWQASGENAICT